MKTILYILYERKNETNENKFSRYNAIYKFKSCNILHRIVINCIIYMRKGEVWKI